MRQNSRYALADASRIWHHGHMMVMLRSLFLVVFIGALLLPIGVAIGRSWLLRIPPVAALAYLGYLMLRRPQSVTLITLVALALFVVVADTWMFAGVACTASNDAIDRIRSAAHRSAALCSPSRRAIGHHLVL